MTTQKPRANGAFVLPSPAAPYTDAACSRQFLPYFVLFKIPYPPKSPNIGTFGASFFNPH